ncbi:hypothetical protein DFJ58DRAFT_714811 [Suillus subalutaceus]|uniref:uncharacterized protein n=1 Tax=Suillus subalutaceus TaxID=48586 RepID=UPI001B87CD18|nr:uncharacterized protein DFJ58DRAFT_714811 [Suillus subalutaceus]KAG1865025.1 hypothetical protein DFJ58DRAFT_714811 [Suillus subalutaceus]
MSSFQCPSCGKGGFKNDVAVARHMSQPRSGCSMWLQDLACFRPESDDSRMDSDDEPNISMDMDDGPNIPDIESGSTGGSESQGMPTHNSEVIDSYPDCAQTYGKGYTFLDLFNSDNNSKHRAMNPYYPFSSRKDWEVGSWLLRSGLSMGKIDSFLSLEMIKTLPLSFLSARELRSRAEMLPSGPRWMSQIIPTKFPTKLPIVLYWRDPLDCISSLLNHPAFHDQLDFTPRRVYTTAQRLCRVFSEWATGDDAWNMQSALPKGATLLGTILSSDKTNVSTMTGDRVAHPLLVSLANIRMSTRLKSSSNAFVLTALLPDRLIHECLDIVLRPLKVAAREGVMLSDPIGHTTTLSQLATARSKVDPDDIEAFFREAQKFRLNGVNTPFWLDWPLSDPSHFLTPEFLHLIHREFYDHDRSEIDFRFSVLQVITGFRHFHGGISKLKQVTGRAQRDIQRSIVAVSADAVPSTVMAAVRALMDFWYLVQSPVIDDIQLTHISTALEEFHANKDAIIDGGFRRGQRGGVIENWYIPKLELMQSIVPSIRNTGVSLQWTADTTEHAHITEIKDPARSSNNNNYDPQICHHLDCTDKCRRFDLAMNSKRQGSDDVGDVNDNVDLDADDDHDDGDVDFDTDVDHDIPHLLAMNKYPGHSRLTTNYFEIAKVLQHREAGTVPVPLRAFIIERTAFHLAYDLLRLNISVDDAAIKFGLPDLRPAIADFLRREDTHGRDHIHTIGGARRAGPTTPLPFDKLQVWFKLRLQDTDFHDISIIRPAQTLNCAPPSDPWTSGRYDTAIINNKARCVWPTDGLHAPLAQRAKRSNGTRVGDIVPVTQLRALVNLVPRFGASADNRLTPYNSMEHASQFWLNKYWDKNSYFPLSM